LITRENQQNIDLAWSYHWSASLWKHWISYRKCSKLFCIRTL